MPDQTAPSQTSFGRLLPTLLLVLTAFGPISMDLYLPALPALTRELGAATSVAQLTVTACLIGLAAYVVTSLLCAMSPTVETLIVARCVQGLAGGVGIVIANAAGRDIYT